MDDIGNPVRNAQWVWLEVDKFLQSFVNLNRNSRKTIQIFAKFWNSSRFWISRFWIPQKLQLSFLQVLKFLGTQFGVVHLGGGGVFSGIAIATEDGVIYVRNKLIRWERSTLDLLQVRLVTISYWNRKWNQSIAVKLWHMAGKVWTVMLCALSLEITWSHHLLFKYVIVHDRGIVLLYTDLAFCPESANVVSRKYSL